MKISTNKGSNRHSDRDCQYTSKGYRDLIKLYGLIQSINSEGGRCHNNARCEAIWARIKEN